MFFVVVNCGEVVVDCVVNVVGGMTLFCFEKWDRLFGFIFEGRWLGNVLKVGVLEEGGVFESEAEEAVQGYVCDPDEGERGG